MSEQPENVRERTLRTRSFAFLAINHFLYCKCLHYYNFGARIVESWDIDNMGKTKDIADMLETYLLATRKDKKEKNSKEMAKRQLAAGELLLTMSVSRGSTTLRVILEEVRNNIQANTDELIEALDWLRSGIGDPKNPWKTAVEDAARDLLSGEENYDESNEEASGQDAGDGEAQSPEDEVVNLVSGHPGGDPDDPSDDDEDEDGDDDRGGRGRLTHGKEDAVRP